MNGQGQMQPSEILKFCPSCSHAQFPTCHKYPAARKLLQMAAAHRRTPPLLKYNSEVGLFEEEPKIDPLGGVGRRAAAGPEGMNERIGLLGIYGMEFALCIPCPCPPTDNDLSLSLHPQFLIAARRSNSFSAASTTATARGTPFRPGVSLTPWSSNREFDYTLAKVS